MSPTVDLQNGVVEMLDAQTQSSDTHFSDGPELVVGECSRFGFEGDFCRLIPRKQTLHALGQIAELVRRQVARSPSTEVDEAGFSPADHCLGGKGSEVFEQGIQVGLDVVGILVGVDAEVTKVTSLPAEGNVDVESQRYSGLRGLIQSLMEGWNGLSIPEGKRGIIGNEVIPGGGLPLYGRSRGCGRRGNGDGAHGRAVGKSEASAHGDGRQWGRALVSLNLMPTRVAGSSKEGALGG